MVFNHGYGQPDPEGGIATMEKALDLGINFWDTADIYANGENEKLVSRVLRPNRSKVFLASKFGFLQYAGHKLSGIDGSPAYVRQAVEASLQRLGTDVIDLYYLHRVDPDVPVEETVGAMSDLVREGKVRYLGLSEVSAKTLKRAHAVHPISALQSEYSILSREPEGSILDACRELGVSFVAFSPLARGLMTNTLDLNQLGDPDFRQQRPR
jgi:aryl-alcohol dehydrogenase-like predicted oxidoreductase